MAGPSDCGDAAAAPVEPRWTTAPTAALVQLGLELLQEQQEEMKEHQAQENSLMNESVCSRAQLEQAEWLSGLELAAPAERARAAQRQRRSPRNQQ